MNQTAKNIIVITSITVVAGLLLGFVNEITKDPIKEGRLKAKQEACKTVYPEAESFESVMDYSKDELDEYLQANGFTLEESDEVLSAKDLSGNAIGYVYGVTTHNGYGGDISVYVGIDSSGTTKGVEILSISETAGLGMKANTPEFKQQFSGKNVSRFSYTKTGKTQDYEIDALSGATITTNAMTNAVNAALCLNEKIGGGI